MASLVAGWGLNADTAAGAQAVTSLISASFYVTRRKRKKKRTSTGSTKTTQVVEITKTFTQQQQKRIMEMKINE